VEKEQERGDDTEQDFPASDVVSPGFSRKFSWLCRTTRSRASRTVGAEKPWDHAGQRREERHLGVAPEADVGVDGLQDHHGKAHHERRHEEEEREDGVFRAGSTWWER